MSESANPLLKPKVRFTNSPKDSNPPGPFQGPRIREIVTLKKPVRLVTLPQDKITSRDDEDVVPTSSRAPPTLQKPPSIPKISILPPEPQIPPKDLQKNPTTTSTSSYTSRKPKKSPPDVEDLQRKLEELTTSDRSRQKNLQNQKILRDLRKPPETKKIDKTTEKIPSKSILRSKNTPGTLVRSGISREPEKKIENKENVNKKELNSEKSIKKVISDEKIIVKKSTTVGKKENICSDVLKKSSGGGGGRKDGKCTRRSNVGIGGGNLGLMPCMKGKKVEGKKKTKVDVLRNVSRPIPSVFVGPGVPREQRHGPSEEAGMVRKVEGSEDLLSRPEYNSIVCTIKKLKEVKKKKVVENFEGLPSAYKDLVNGKVSSALDFPPCESVYHDLVDISIDEKQLPMRLTRSRDPEPRPKDFFPNLSDFFVPQYQKEYSVAVKVRPRTPEIIDNWSGFNIFDRINNWKMSLDEPSN